MKRVFFICLIILSMAFQCGPYEWNEPSVIVKNDSNREISLQFTEKGCYDATTNSWKIDTTKINLLPEQTFCFHEGGLTDGYEDDPYTQEHLDWVFYYKPNNDTLLVKDASNESEVLRVWTKNYDITSPLREFFRLTDWKRKLNGGNQNNDAFVFEIKESDFIN